MWSTRCLDALSLLGAKIPPIGQIPYPSQTRQSLLVSLMRPIKMPVPLLSDTTSRLDEVLGAAPVCAAATKVTFKVKADNEYQL